ncbi:MAG TPA: ATP-binding protein, partial [Lacipirellulaceae bacterium]|nr:ATP-binding protein [Lacipirellulaceae bacterium]
MNVLIGPNGSGKSRLLRKLCTSFLRRGDEVIAIAPTIYDRFRRMPKRGLRFYGARQGRNAAIYVVRSALERASAQNPQILKNLTRALEYTNFEPVIGIRLSDLNLDNFPAAEEHLARDEAENLRSALLKWQSRRERPDIIRLRLDS